MDLEDDCRGTKKRRRKKGVRGSTSAYVKKLDLLCSAREAVQDVLGWIR